MNSLSFIGSHLLALALPTILYSGLMYGVGAKRRHFPLIESAQRATVLVFFLISGAVLVLVTGFLINDFSILYISRYSSRSLPFFYKLTGLWAGLDGSILFWTWLVSFYSFLVLRQNSKKNPDWMPVLNGVMMTVLLFFMSLMLFFNNPFTPSSELRMDGDGLNPLLQNLAMVVHPPSLYLGYTGFTVPFAFMIAALATRRLDTTWIEASRRWTIIPWFFLTLGLILGGAWAYVELGWGGFWAWDPVENAALLPWLTGTAYLHSVLIQKKRGMLATWNVVLIALTFVLTLFGTYLTRSGVVQSVHAFSESHLGPFFLGFIGFIILGTVILILNRRDHLRSQNTLESYVSKESAFLFNNIILIASAFAVLWGTLFPTLSEAVTGQRITVGQPFFNQVMAPLAVILLFLMGIGPLISWKKATLHHLKQNVLGPLLLALAVALALAVSKITQWYVLASGAGMAFAASSLYVEFSRGIQVVRLQNKCSFVEAFIELLRSSNRRYGGYIVHWGILLIFLGIAGGVFKEEADFSLTPGQEFTFHNYRFRYVEPLLSETEHKLNVSAVVTLYRGNQKLAELKPAKYFYRQTEQPSTEVAIYPHALGDVYLILGNLAPMTGWAEFRVTLNPLISFIWLGGMVILMGVVIILLPRGFKLKPKPKVLLMLFFLLGWGSPLFADQPSLLHEVKESMGSPLQNINDPDHKHLWNLSEKLICQCGGCVRMPLSSCPCEFAKAEREKILGLMHEGKSDQDILNLFTQKYGLVGLTVPPKKGFFKIGYWVPLCVLILCIGIAMFILRSWFGRSAAKKENPKIKKILDPELEAYIQKFSKELTHHL